MTTYYWDEVSDNIVCEEDETGAITAQYQHEPSLYGELISQIRDSKTSYYHFDGQGTTRALTDTDENVTDTSTYTAFGEEVTNAGITINPFGYVGALGYYANPETNDVYIRARTYEPKTAQWLSEDPLTTRIGQANSFVYCHNRPTNLADPNGLDAVPLPINEPPCPTYPRFCPGTYPNPKPGPVKVPACGPLVFIYIIFYPDELGDAEPDRCRETCATEFPGTQLCPKGSSGWFTASSAGAACTKCNRPARVIPGRSATPDDPVVDCPGRNDFGFPAAKHITCLYAGVGGPADSVFECRCCAIAVGGKPAMFNLFKCAPSRDVYDDDDFDFCDIIFY